MRGLKIHWNADGRKQRDSERHSVCVPAQLRPEGERMLQVHVGDLSATGFMAHTNEPIVLGCYVLIELPGLGLTQARVRWTVGARVGARFLEPIDVEQCRAAIIRLADAA